MLKILFSSFLILTLCSCQYSIGENSQNMSGLYHIRKVENLTPYRLASTQLRAKLTNVLQRNKGTKISGLDKAEYVIHVSIIGINKVDKEIDPITGLVNESQFIVKVDFSVKNKGKNLDYKTSNINYKNSSGTFRVLNDATDTATELLALDSALSDLSESIISKMSGLW